MSSIQTTVSAPDTDIQDGQELQLNFAQQAPIFFVQAGQTLLLQSPNLQPVQLVLGNQQQPNRNGDLVTPISPEPGAMQFPYVANPTSPRYFRQRKYSAEDKEEDYLEKRAKNNEAVKKSRAKTKQRLQEMETEQHELRMENERLKTKQQELERTLHIEKSKNEHLMQVITIARSPADNSTSKACNNCHSL